MSAKPQRKQKLPKYRQNKASGRAVVTLNGQDHWLGKWDTPESREKYDRLIAQWLANGRQLPTALARKPADLTVVELLDVYWQHAQTYYRHPDGTPTDEQGCIAGAIKILNELYGTTAAADFGPLALDALRAHMIRLGWCRNYINAQIGRVRRIFKFAVSKELIDQSVYAAICTLAPLLAGRSQARDTKPVQSVDPEIVKATKAKCPPVLKDMIELQEITGMRSGELVIMRAVDIEMGKEIWVYTPQRSKMEYKGFTRKIALGPKAKEIVQKYITPDVSAYLFSPKAAIAWRASNAKSHRRPDQRPNAPQTDRKVRDRYDRNSYRDSILRASRKAYPMPAELTGDDLTPEQLKQREEWAHTYWWRPHQLRHLCATRLERQFGKDKARAVLGHQDVKITERYIDRDLAHATEIMSAVG